MGTITHNVLRIIAWLCAVLAVPAFVPWLDAHSLDITADGPRSMTALGDAVLFAAVSLACVFLASQMMRDPSELIWAGLVIAGGTLFVLAGSEMTESTQACSSNGTILGLSNGLFDFGCFREGGYTDSPGQIFLWVVLGLTTFVAISALCLPMVENFGRDDETTESAEQW